SSELHTWSYSACPNPRDETSSCMLSGAGCSAACWIDLSSKTVASGADIHLVDDPALAQNPIRVSTLRDYRAAPPPLPADAFRLFRRESGGGGSITCPPLTVSDAVFRYDPNLAMRFPRGVWLIDGEVKLQTSNPMAPCPAMGLWAGASWLVRGSMEIHPGEYSLWPPLPLEAALGVGGDLKLETGDSTFSTCGTGAAIAVHEQLLAAGNNVIHAPLLVENAPTCFSDVNSATAIDFPGTVTVRVDAAPLLSVEPLTELSWMESTL
ncbi:MAG: hypothetical protein HY901_27350, partial [Deltaproteobacteria bacterium]|nr:hypothetical protein [Deltaproteobacteria bacterium]